MDRLDPDLRAGIPENTEDLVREPLSDALNVTKIQHHMFEFFQPEKDPFGFRARHETAVTRAQMHHHAGLVEFVIFIRKGSSYWIRLW